MVSNSKLHTPHANYHLPQQKHLSLNEKHGHFLINNRTDHCQKEKKNGRESCRTRTRLNNKGGGKKIKEKKAESNDNPEGPDRRETSDTPSLTSGEVTRK